jgi:hypothetical protein
MDYFSFVIQISWRFRQGNGGSLRRAIPSSAQAIAKLAGRDEIDSSGGLFLEAARYRACASRTAGIPLICEKPALIERRYSGTSPVFAPPSAARRGLSVL